MANQIEVALLEDHPMFRAGIKFSLASACHICLEEKSGIDFLAKVDAARPQVAVLDLMLPDISGVEVARTLKERYGEEIRILVLSVDTREETLEELTTIGVEGFLSKNAPEEELLEAVKTIVKGETFYSRPAEVLEREIMLAAHNRKHDALTRREFEIVQAFCMGLSNKEIADKMFISPKTVDNHKQHIFAKLGIHNVTQLVTYAIRHKIISL